MSRAWGTGGLAAAALLLVAAGAGATELAAVGYLSGRFVNHQGSALEDARIRNETTGKVVPLGGQKRYFLRVAPGTYWFRAEAFGYRVVRRRVVVREDETTEIDFVLNSLVHAPYRGQVRDAVSGEGVAAYYWILDAPVPPRSSRPDGGFGGLLPQGKHRLRFSAFGYYAREVEVTAPTRPFTVDLKPMVPGEQRGRHPRFLAVWRGP